MSTLFVKFENESLDTKANSTGLFINLGLVEGFLIGRGIMVPKDIWNIIKAKCFRKIAVNVVDHFGGRPLDFLSWWYTQPEQRQYNPVYLINAHNHSSLFALSAEYHGIRKMFAEKMFVEDKLNRNLDIILGIRTVSGAKPIGNLCIDNHTISLTNLKPFCVPECTPKDKTMSELGEILNQEKSKKSFEYNNTNKWHCEQKQFWYLPGIFPLAMVSIYFTPVRFDCTEPLEIMGGNFDRLRDCLLKHDHYTPDHKWIYSQGRMRLRSQTSRICVCKCDHSPEVQVKLLNEQLIVKRKIAGYSIDLPKCLG